MRKTRTPIELLEELLPSIEPTPEKLRALRYRIHEIENDTRRANPAYAEESPRSAVVQRLAGYALTYLHDTREMSFESIAEMFEVSTERIRSLYHKLTKSTATEP